MESISPSCMHKGTGGVKGSECDSCPKQVASRTLTLAKFSFYHLWSYLSSSEEWATQKGKGKVGSLDRYKQMPIHPQSQPSNSQNLKRKNLPLQQLEKIENGLFIEI